MPLYLLEQYALSEVGGVGELHELVGVALPGPSGHHRYLQQERGNDVWKGVLGYEEVVVMRT
jgi:hypothetical protein